jgi:hypothetical protein
VKELAATVGSAARGDFTMPQWALCLICVAAGSALLFPALYFEFPLSVDYLNHLSRLHVMAHAADPFFASIFIVKLELIPNLALDAGAMAAQALGLGEEAYLKAFYVVSAIMMWAGIVTCHIAIHRRLRSSILLVLPVCYGFIMTDAVMDFALAIGIALCVFAWVIRAKPAAVLSIPALNLLGLVIFFCHLGAFLVLALSIFLYRIAPIAWPVSRRVFWRRIAPLAIRSAAESFLPLALYMTAYHASVTGVEWATIPSKLWWLAAGFSVGSPALALIAASAFVAMIAALLICGDVTLDARWRPLVLGFAAIGVIAPFGYHGSFIIDARLIWCACITLLLTMEFSPRGEAWGHYAAMSLAAGILITDTVWLTGATGRYNRDIAAFRQAIEAVPLHSFVFVTMPVNQKCESIDDRFYDYIPALLTIDRASAQPYIFANAGMVAMSTKPERAGYFSPSPQPPVDDVLAALMAANSRVEVDSGDAVFKTTAFISRWASRFPYVVDIGSCREPTTLDHNPAFRPLADGRFFKLYSTEAAR